MDKKYKYYVCQSAENSTIGFVELTQEQAEIVAYATDPGNWTDVKSYPYSGHFTIIADDPREIED